ncbi:hypothetical protein ACIF8T_07475 [Streptomyces sp. NPDC085946]|uniref:hypothetical protein n=1 Tax=Streptomyces sp. NPDC085946 TaxID=3365744 RepID=UPI0037D2917B
MKMTESAGWTLLRLPPDRRRRLLRTLADLARAEQDPARREFLASFPFTVGMADDQRG